MQNKFNKFTNVYGKTSFTIGNISVEYFELNFIAIPTYSSERY